MMKVNAMSLAAAAVALACASTGSAQQADTTALDKPAVNAPSCAELSWQKEIVARYPNIAAACQEVVVSNDVPFARFSGELVQVNRNGSVKVDFKDREGRSMGKATMLQPAPTQRVLIEGRSYRFSELPLGQELSMYIPESRLVVATEPTAPPDAVAKIVLDEPVVTAEQPVEPVRIADATPQSATVQPARLPDTAGWTPILGLAGLIALAGAILLEVKRRHSARRAGSKRSVSFLTTS
jgi:hypothetical protein